MTLAEAPALAIELFDRVYVARAAGELVGQAMVRPGALVGHTIITELPGGEVGGRLLDAIIDTATGTGEGGTPKKLIAVATPDGTVDEKLLAERGFGDPIALINWLGAPEDRDRQSSGYAQRHYSLTLG